jgi:hypothetical protein
MKNSEIKSFLELDDAHLLERLEAEIEKLWKENVSEIDFVRQLNPSQRVVYLLFVFEGEIGNGGLSQFFFNRGIEIAMLVPEAYREAGLIDHEQFVQKVLHLVQPHVADFARESQVCWQDYLNAKAALDLNEYDEEFSRITSAGTTRKLNQYLRAHLADILSVSGDLVPAQKLSVVDKPKLKKIKNMVCGGRGNWSECDGRLSSIEFYFNNVTDVNHPKRKGIVLEIKSDYDAGRHYVQFLYDILRSLKLVWRKDASTESDSLLARNFAGGSMDELASGYYLSLVEFGRTCCKEKVAPYMVASDAMGLTVEYLNGAKIHC